MLGSPLVQPHVSRFSRRGPPDSRHHAVVALSARVCIAPYRRVETFAIRGAKCPRNPAPEGRPSLAQRFSVCVRTRFRATRWNEAPENPAPEGRASVAQRFQRREKRAKKWIKWLNPRRSLVSQPQAERESGTQ